MTERIQRELRYKIYNTTVHSFINSLSLSRSRSLSLELSYEKVKKHAVRMQRDAACKSVLLVLAFSCRRQKAVRYRELLILRLTRTCLRPSVGMPLHKRFCSFAQMAGS